MHEEQDYHIVWPMWQKVATVIPLSLIIICIVLGNLLVVVAVLTQKSLRTPSNIYIVSLALTDLMVGVFILPFNIIDMIHGWKFGKVLCRIWLTSDVTLCSASILHISAIAVDRFRSINEGLSYAQSRTKRSSIIVCASLYFLAIWIASPPVLGWNDWSKHKHPESNDCNNNATDTIENVNSTNTNTTLLKISTTVSPVQKLEKVDVCMLTNELGYIIHSATGAFFIPAIVMAGLYVRIFFLLKKKFRERATVKCVDQNSHELDSSDTGNNSSADVIEDSKRKESNSSSSGTGTINKFRRKQSEQISEIIKNKIKFSLSKERKAAKTLGILIGAFILCWAPFTITYICSGILPRGSVNPRFFQFVTWLGYVNSLVNPIIYTVYSQEFKRGFVKVLCPWKY